MSERATVMPPPVRGCLMLTASPIRRTPGVGRGAAGMLLFGIDFMFPLSAAAIKAAYSSGGTCNKQFANPLIRPKIQIRKADMKTEMVVI